MRCGMKVARLVCLGAMIGSTGCFSLGRTPPPQKHFVLGADGGSRDAFVPPVSFDITIGVRRLKLASYLASPFMVVRRGPNQVDFAEFHRWGEPLEADREYLASISPIHQVDSIRAPLMVIHGANDPRVPVSEARQLAAALAERGVPVELLVFDDEGHTLSKIKNKLTAYGAIVDFLDGQL